MLVQIDQGWTHDPCFKDDSKAMIEVCGGIQRPVMHGSIFYNELHFEPGYKVMAKEFDVVPRSAEQGSDLKNSGSRRDTPVIKVESVPFHIHELGIELV